MKNNDAILDILAILDNVKNIANLSDASTSQVNFFEEKNIFKRLLFLSKTIVPDTENKPSHQRIKEYVEESVQKTIIQSKNIVIDSIIEYFSAGEECGKTIFINDQILEIPPNSFDLFDVLKIIPDSDLGQIIYENDTEEGKIKYNKKLFELFDTEDAFVFESLNKKVLFSIKWDNANQHYVIENFIENDKQTIGEFLENYYNTIEYPNFQTIFKDAMFSTIGKDDPSAKHLHLKSDLFFKLLEKLFSFCIKDKPNLISETPINQEDELEINGFLFDENEHIFLEEIENKMRGVIKFKNCNDIEIPINNDNFSDFIYFVNKDTQEKVFRNAIDKISDQYFIQSDKNFPRLNFEIFFYENYYKSLPYSLFRAIFSPKIFFPISIIELILTKTLKTSKDFLKDSIRFFYNVIKKIFWVFIKELWGFIKKDIMNFIKNFAKKIIKEKILRFKLILQTLISVFRRAKDNNIDNCDGLYGNIFNLINGLLLSTMKIPIPGIMLVLSEMLPGFNQTRAYLNISQNLSNLGVPLTDLYGRHNKLNDIIKGIVDGYSQEMDENSYVKIALKPSILPVTPGGAIINPTITGVGKLF